MTKPQLMKKVKEAHHTVWSVWDEAEKMLERANSPSTKLYEATNLIESAKVALMVAYRELGGSIKDLHDLSN
jgi:hypothetical protein